MQSTKTKFIGIDKRKLWIKHYLTEKIKIEILT